MIASIHLNPTVLIAEAVPSKITDKDGKEYKLVLGKFNKFFTEVRKNVIFERAGFNWRNELEGVSSEQQTVLHSLVENYNYGNLKHKAIHDKL